ncbi:hypothetical protein DFP73DRAFT_545202 [Morchella snyderi]|nr:hypothetical protein DFP73DRAFT_545202 [Morchella snyderi]
MIYPYPRETIIDTQLLNIPPPPPALPPCHTYLLYLSLLLLPQLPLLPHMLPHYRNLSLVRPTAVVQKVYQRHNIAQHDMGYRKIDKDLIDKAKADLLAELPNLFRKCDSDWFADWALSRRHKTRNTKKTTTPSGSKRDAQALDEEQMMMMQAADMGDSQSAGNNSPENKVPPPPPPPPLPMPPSTGANTTSTPTTTTTAVTTSTTVTTTGSFRPW